MTDDDDDDVFEFTAADTAITTVVTGTLFVTNSQSTIICQRVMELYRLMIRHTVM